MCGTLDFAIFSKFKEGVFVMKKISWFLSLILIAVLLIETVPAIFVFSESKQQNHWADETFEELIQSGIIAHDEVAFPNYDNPITRGDFTKWFVWLSSGPEFEYGEIYFSDIEPESEYFIITAQAKKNNLIAGFEDGTFKPNEFIQRQDLFSIIGRALESGGISIPDKLFSNQNEYEAIPFVDEQSIAQYAKIHIQTLTSIGLIKGYEDNTVRPEQTITHAEAAIIIFRIKTMMHNNQAGDQNQSLPIETPRPTRSPRPSRSPRTADSPEHTPALTPIPTPTVTPSSPTIGYNSGQSGGGSSVYSNNNNPSNNNFGQNNSQNEPITNDYYDENIVADIDSILSLKDIKNIGITFSNPGLIPEIYISSQNNLQILVQYLRRLHLGEPIEIFLTGGGYGLDVYYHDNNKLELFINGGYIYYDGLHYPILHEIDGKEFGSIVGRFLLENYRAKELFEISGVLVDSVAYDETSKRYFCELLDKHGNRHIIDLTGIGFVFDMRGSGNLILFAQDEVTIFYRRQGFQDIQKVIITGPKVFWGIEDLVSLDEVTGIRIETSPYEKNYTKELESEQTQVIDIFRSYMRSIVLSKPKTYEEASADYNGVLNQQEEVRVCLSYNNGTQSELVLIGNYVFFDGAYYLTITSNTRLESITGDFLSQIFLMNGLTEISGTFENPVMQEAEPTSSFEFRDNEGNITIIDITNSEIFDARLNGDKVIMPQVEARVYFSDNDLVNVARIIIPFVNALSTV